MPRRDDPVVKDAVVESLIPDIITECTITHGKSTCMSHQTAEKISKIIGVTGDDETIIERAKEKLTCQTEKCVLTKLAPQLGRELVRREISQTFKIAGPTDSSLLTNINIEDVLNQWARAYPRFYPYNFNMVNYMDYSYRDGYIVNEPDTLATVAFGDLYPKYNCAACVINSDVYQGNGIHWMALFADARGDKWSVEFFNSSGNAPAPEWVSWLVKTKNQMEEIHPQVEIIRVSSIRHQRSKTECGMYSLFYIWARLNGVPASYFTHNVVLDQLMFEFRQHLFADDKSPAVRQFNWDEYKSRVRIIWE